MQSSTNMLKVICNDRQCQAEMFVPTAETNVTCFRCGQQHEIRNLKNVHEITESQITNALARYLQFKVLEVRLPRKGTEMVKVLGLSNYHCKLLSPFLTKYGMEKITGLPKLLREMNLGEIFDCTSFCDRAFRIEPEHIPIAGFGRDITGSLDYLSETLKLIKSSNGDEERLLPIYTDGDGHCLVHSISRALLGRELFWHPLRCSLKRYFETNLDKFKELFKDFIDTDEWQSIIDECDPDFKPPDGELHGLRNIHIFGLANVLRRPIILLDSLECMQKSGDYSALFLPGFVHPDECRGRENALNKPICIAWSSYSHNHYIPLVGVQKMPLPVLPRSLIPKVWGMPQSEIMTYMEFDETENCIIGGDRILSDNYIQRLVIAMENQFYQRYGVHPALVTDTKLFMCSDNVLLNTSVATVTHKARIIVSEGRMFRCLNCKALVELHFDTSAFLRGGDIYTHLVNNKTKLSPGIPHYVTTPHCHITCSYDVLKDCLVPDKTSFKMRECSFCWYVISSCSKF